MRKTTKMASIVALVAASVFAGPAEPSSKALGTSDVSAEVHATALDPGRSYCRDECPPPPVELAGHGVFKPR